MSFDNYVHHITQKYRLATAIAVLRVKPENLPIEAYISALKNKISNNSMDTDFLDISLESDDFNFDDENDDLVKEDNVFEGDTERKSLNDSETILEDINMDIELNENAGHEADSFDDVMGLLKDVDLNVENASKTVTTDNLTQRTFCESLQTKNTAQTVELIANYTDVEMQVTDFHNSKINDTQDLFSTDSNSAVVVNEVKLIRNKNFNSDRTNFECESETYSDNMKVTDNFVRFDNKQSTMAENVLKNISKESKISFVNKTANISLVNKAEPENLNNDIKNIRNPVNKTIKLIQNSTDDYGISIETQHMHRNSGMANKVCQNLEKVNQNTMNDSQSTILYSLYGNTQNFTHVSQSQYEVLKVHDHFIHGSKKNNDEDRNTTKTQCPSDSKTFNADIANNSNGYDLPYDLISGNNNITYASQIVDVDPSEIQYVIDKNGRTYRVLEGLSKKNTSIDTNTVLNTTTTIYDSNSTTNQNLASQDLFQSQNNPVSLQKRDKTAKKCEIKDKTEEETQDFVMTQDIYDGLLDDDLTASQKEVIPFKVIEELNKIKTFLNRKMDRRASTDSYSTDSGYKSDSQSRSSFKSALQLTGNTINQSAHCVYTHLLQCPLVGSTEEITLEVSTMLGRLIDKLHENEKYPSFLEEILDSIDNLLKDIIEKENSGDTIILSKDESIQRFLLLNKSSHVIQYSIEKITSILEKLHADLTYENNLYELTDVDVIENVCYIFHVLEILIKRYRKTKKDGASSQNNTQNSQDSEGILKKSSITDIWRKKWNPDYKNVKTEGTLDKKCVLTKCGEILNKVIVDCMEGYSLVSFAALQCFNLLQS